jgi:D-alanine-D-alanine ligase
MYDYQAKYESSATQYFMPARLDGPRYQGVLNLAERAARALDCRGAVRVDLMVTEGQNEYVLEVNSLPGMTENSLLPKIASAVGYDFPSLCDAILQSARLELSAGKRSRSSEPVSAPRASAAPPAPELARLAG